MKTLLLIIGVMFLACMAQPGWDTNRAPLAIIGAVILFARERFCK